MNNMAPIVFNLDSARRSPRMTSYQLKAAALRAYAARVGVRTLEGLFRRNDGEIGLSFEVSLVVDRRDLGEAMLPAEILLAAEIGLYISARDGDRAEIHAATYGPVADLGRELTVEEKAEIEADRCVEVTR